MNLRFGVLWPFRNPAFNKVPWEQLYRSHLDLISASEGLGYDDAWLTEHHFVDDGYSPSLLAIAAALSQRTTNIRIGTFLVLAPLHNPIRLAEDTATVDLMSNGRFDLGVGLGYRRKEFSDQGISHTERGGRLQEGMAIVQKLLSGESVTHDGKYYYLKDIKISPPALQRPHPPIWLGAIAPRAIERAAKMGFHFQSVGPAELNAAYDGALTAAGRDPKEYNIAAQRAVYVAKSRSQAWEECAQSLHYLTECYAKWFAEANDQEGDDQALKNLPTVEEMIKAQSFNFFGEDAIVGTPDDAKQMISDYVSRGRFTHMVLQMALPGLAPHLIHKSMDIFAKNVLPAFKK